MLIRLIIGLAMTAIVGLLAVKRVRWLTTLIRSGQPVADERGRKDHLGERIGNQIREVFGQTRLLKWSIPGIAHFFTMWGFFILATVYLEAYGVLFDPKFHIPVVGKWAVLGFLQDFFAVAVLLGIITFAIIRLRSEPKEYGRSSRFYGSHTGGAWLILFMIFNVIWTYALFRGAAVNVGNFPYDKAAFFSHGVGSLLAPLGLHTNEIIETVALLLHLGVALVFLLIVLHSKHLHIGLAPLNVTFKRLPNALGPLLPMESNGALIDFEDPAEDAVFGRGKIEDFTWKGYLDFTTCTECGRCQSQCPAWNTGKPLSPKLLIMDLRDHLFAKAPYVLGTKNDAADTDGGLEIGPDNPHHVPESGSGRVPADSPLQATRNAKERLTWIDEVDFDVPVYGRDVDSFAGFEYLFWVGCAGALDDRAKKTTKAVAELLSAAGVKFLVLGDGETCTGDSARRSGNEFLFQQLAAQNVATINDLFEGVERVDRKVVVTCPHCFNALGREYPQVGGNYTVLHHTQLLNRLVRDKKLIPVQGLNGNGSSTITYHDPCYLGRHNKVYDAPRELIGAAGATLTEMPRHAERGFCCGAGGARMWMEEHLGKRVNHERVDEALTLDPEKIATGCPFCRVMLSDGVGDRGKADEVEVVDVAQLLLGSLDRSTITLPEKGAAAKLAAAAAPPAKPAVAQPETVESKPAPAAPVAPATPAATEAPAVKGLGIAAGAKRPGATKAEPTATTTATATPEARPEAQPAQPA
ncbi:MAG: (Fe-S)-binding protein, partial [Mycobacteriaceae bacterium]|nr:(Fe-S)-binding protein [Mycobacteriaceae bacterium]